MSTSYNFKDNLTIDNNKYLKWLDITGTSRSNVINLDDSNNVNLNSPLGNLYFNSTNSFFNSNTLLSSNVAIGFNTTRDINSVLSINFNNFISTNDGSGYLGFTGDTHLENTSKILSYGSTFGDKPSCLELYCGSNSNSNIKMYSGDSLKFQILQNGTSTFMPNGITSRLVISDTSCLFTNDIYISSSTESHNASTGCLKLEGGIGIKGNLYVDGTISLNNATGNINFDSSQTSTSYTSGAIFLSGGIGISTTVNSSSVTSGGALSIAGGAAIGKDTYIGGNLTIISTTACLNSFNGSVVVYGGIGVNGSSFLRSSGPQFNIAPISNGNESSISFSFYNNFINNSTHGSWKIGQNINSNSTETFSIVNTNLNDVLTLTSDAKIGFFTSSPQNSLQLGSGNRFTISNDNTGFSIIGT